MLDFRADAFPTPTLDSLSPTVRANFFAHCRCCLRTRVMCKRVGERHMDKERRCLEDGTARRRATRGRFTQPPPSPPPRNLLVVYFIDCPAGIDCASSKTSMMLS